MKPRIIDQDGTTARHERSVGDAPGIGKVAKVSEVQAIRHGERKKRRSSHMNTESRDGKVKQFLKALIFVVGFLWLAAWMFSWASKKEPEHREVREGTQLEALGDHSFPDEMESLNLVRRALAVRHVLRVKDYFRVSPALDETEVVRFLEQMEQRDGLMIGLDALAGIQVDGVLMGRVLITTSGSGHPKQRMAFLVADSNGMWKLDYASLARVVEPSWASLWNGRAQEGIVRVSIQPMEFEVDLGKQAGWSMVSPDVEEEMFGYCHTESAQWKALQEVKSMGDAPNRHRVTLVVRPMEGKARGHFQILRVIADGWVVFEEPFDGRFDSQGAL